MGVGGGEGTQVCLYFEDAEHGHIIPGLDYLNVGQGGEELAVRCQLPHTKKIQFPS